MESQQPATVEEIRAQMRTIRRDLRVNMKGVVANATQMFDWKTYVRSFPWTSVLVVGAVGYLLVPRRSRVVAYDKAALEKVLKEHQLVMAPPPTPKTSLLSNLIQAAGTAALRMGVAYATKYGTDFIASLGQPTASSHGSRPDRPDRAPQGARTDRMN